MAAAAVLASCGAVTPGSAGLPVLVRDGVCVFAQGPDPGDRWLPIWPPGFSMAGDLVMDGGEEVARVGDVVELGGGEYHEREYGFLRTLMPADVPAACRGGAYWLVGEIVP